MPRAPRKAVEPDAIKLPKFDLRNMQIRLEGDSPLICHNWSAKAKAEMLAKQTKEALPAREAKDPHQDFLDSLYPYPGGGYGFPAIAFKACAVDSCSFISGVTKVLARGAFHINKEYLRIEGSEPMSREDMVKIGMGTADLRYRAAFWPWEVSVPMRYNAGALSAEQIVNMFENGGFSVGIGEWRPQRDGSMGLFHVKRG